MENREQCLTYLKPIWNAKGWSLDSLKKKPLNQITAIYLKYKRDPQEVNRILNAVKPKYEQTKLFI
jgi:hypothetical protein